jgi:hypothetical protein
MALQADGWYLRSSIIWAKPNPMPESCSDRPTSAHEHIFLLTKSGSSTFWTHRDHGGSRTQPLPDYRWVHKTTGEEVDEIPPDFDLEPKIWRRINLWRGHDYLYDADAVREEATEPPGRHSWEERKQRGEAMRRGDPSMSGPQRNSGGMSDGSGRNLRNVWTIATAPYPAAHFATFPPELAERCIRAGTSERGCCAACGAPWVRATERTAATYDGRARPSPSQSGEVHRRDCDSMQRGIAYDTITTGWSPSCTCEAETRPCVVLDCFSGAGTALLVADRLGRDAIGIDLSHAYVEMTRERLTADCPLFMAFEASPPPAEDPEETRMADLFQDMAAD